MAKGADIKPQGLSVVLCGPAGVGIATVERLLVQILRLSGFHVFATREYMSRVRGGLNSTSIRVSASAVRCAVDRIDILIPLSKGAIGHLKKRIGPRTHIIAEKENLDGDFDLSGVIDVPFSRIAADIGNKIYSNIVAVGVLSSLFGAEFSAVADFISKQFAGKEQDIAAKNIAAAMAGFDIGRKLQNGLGFDIKPDPTVKQRMLISGVEALGLGCIAAGCNFIGAYPMSPSTGLLTFLAEHGEKFGIVVEQAEDEIAGINMAVGAWYAGSRAVVSTSGGGFALMCEGLSLAGMIESPLVIHLAQRPGPATGLPTRTEQADLELALYAGHGEFPRAIFAPGDVEQCFEFARIAFDMADRCQSPVFILTDQYLIDSYYDAVRFDVSNAKVEHHFIKSDVGYQRFALTDDGVSPRGIPGWGDGVVVADSDEHDTAGHITEDLDLRIKMVDKRLRKFELLKQAVIEPVLWPAKDYRTLVICWGSTLTVVQEALNLLNYDGVSMLHFGQVWPIHPKAAQCLMAAGRTICIEGNATGQFARLLEHQTGVKIHDKILKYNGLQFTVEEVACRLCDILDGNR